jgi:hypothetical protein
MYFTFKMIEARNDMSHELINPNLDHLHLQFWKNKNP